MKVCPICSAIFDDSMNFCLEHGEVLVDPATLDTHKIRPYSNEETLEFKNPISSRQKANTDFIYPQITAGSQKRKSTVPILIIVGILGLLIVGGAVAGGLYIRRQMAGAGGGKIGNSEFPSNQTSTPKPTPMENFIKVEVGQVSKGSFGEEYLKCQITNLSDRVVKMPGVSLTFYEGDVKVDFRSESSKLEYLRPRETIPVWIRINGVKKYDKVVAERSSSSSVLMMETTDVIYPVLNITDQAMKVETLTSSYNFQRYNEKFYNVTGIVENTNSYEVSPKVNVIYYDANSEIVGYSADTVGKLLPGEKAKFEATSGHTQLHGTPVKFELVTTAN